jgi:hypothetical protein
MRLVTVATHSERYFPYLKESAQKNGHSLVILGWGEKWKGFTWKFHLMREYLDSVPDSELVCFVDGYDVIILQRPERIEQKFQELTRGNPNQILISRETFPEDIVGNTYVYALQSSVFQKCNNEFLNTGTYMGSAKTLRGLFQELCNEFDCKADKDDQILLQEFCQLHSSQFTTDTKSSVFLVLNDTLRSLKVGQNGLTMKNGAIQYHEETPCIFHAPGNTDMDDVVQKLGYDPSLFSGKNEFWVRLRYIMKALSHFGSILFKRYGWILGVILLLYFFFVTQTETGKRLLARMQRAV